MGYGNDTNISIACLEDVAACVVSADGTTPPSARPKYRMQTENACSFGLLIRMFNAHKVPYKIEGNTIIVAEPLP